MLLGCKGADDTAPLDTGELEKCELDLDSPWSFNQVQLPFVTAAPRVAVVADRLVLAGADTVHDLDDGLHVGTLDESGRLDGWEALATLPDGTETFRQHTFPGSPNRVVFYGGASTSGCRQELLWADFDGETLGPWNADDTLPEQVVNSPGIFTQEDRLLVMGGLSCSQAGEQGGCWTTTYTEAGPTSWDSIPCMDNFIELWSVAATGRTIHVSGLFQDEDIWVHGFSTAQLEDGIPQEWEMGRSPASTGMGDLAVAEGYLFTGPAGYMGGQHTGTAVLYADANDPLDWYHLPDLPLELGGGTMVAHKGYLYIMGGMDGGNNRIDHIFHRPICVDGSGG